MCVSVNIRCVCVCVCSPKLTSWVFFHHTPQNLCHNLEPTNPSWTPCQLSSGSLVCLLGAGLVGGWHICLGFFLWALGIQTRMRSNAWGISTQPQNHLSSPFLPVSCFCFLLSWIYTCLWHWNNKLAVILYYFIVRKQTFIMNKSQSDHGPLLPTFHVNKSNRFHKANAVLGCTHVSARVLRWHPFNNKFTVSIDAVKVGWGNRLGNNTDASQWPRKMSQQRNIFKVRFMSKSATEP